MVEDRRSISRQATGMSAARRARRAAAEPAWPAPETVEVGGDEPDPRPLKGLNGGRVGGAWAGGARGSTGPLFVPDAGPTVKGAVVAAIGRGSVSGVSSSARGVPRSARGVPSWVAGCNGDVGPTDSNTRRESGDESCTASFKR